MVMAAPIHPYTPEHARMVREALAHVAQAKGLMEKAAMCGADCASDQVFADMLQQALEGYRDNFTEPVPVQATGS
jgi:hypothetical protein